MANPERYDAVIIGGGHNGLTCAAYLAKAGRSVKVLEARDVVGGAAVTEEFHPGFRNSVAAYTVSLLNPKVIADLDLHGHGLEIIERKVNNVWPQQDGGALCFLKDSGEMPAEIARFSKADADNLHRYYRDIEKISALLRDIVLDTPPNVGGGWRELLPAAKLGNRMRGLTLEEQKLLLDLFTRSASDFLDGYFQHDAVRAAFAFDAIVGFYGSPHTPGSAYVLLHHAFGSVNGKKGVWGHAVGGMGAITQAMARAGEAAGVSISTNASVEEVLVEKGRTIGVRLVGGEEIHARAVVANVGPKLLYGRMIDDQHLSAEFRRGIEGIKCGSGTLRINVALDELPRFLCLEGKSDDYLTAGIVIGPTMEYLDRAYTDARRHGWSRHPIVEMLIPSTLDNSLAPEGKHVASLFCQQFAPDLDATGRWPGGWDGAREAAADTAIAAVEEYAPGFADSILGRQILTPLDLERKFGMIGGDIFHGRLSLEQMFSARPLLGYAAYRGPLKGLYMCGSGGHPGGGVTGAPGHNAARELLKDFKWGRVPR